MTLRDAAEAACPFALEVGVDRGSSGYAYLLSATSPDAFAGDALAGYGDDRNPGGSPAYVRISATPSATVSVRRDGVDVGSVNWGELEESGSSIRRRALRIEVVDRGRATGSHDGCVDDETGQPVPCRIHFRSHEGIPFAPHGHHAHVNSNFGTWHVDVGGDLRLGQITYAYIDGECQGWLPRGEVDRRRRARLRVRAAAPRVEIEPGQRELSCGSGASRTSSASAGSRATPTSTSSRRRAAISRQRGEDLNVVNLLLAQWGHLFTNTEEFTGAAERVGRGRDDRVREPGEPAAPARPPDPARPEAAGLSVVLGRARARPSWAARSRRRSRPGPTRATPRAGRSSCRTSRTRTASRRR